MAELVRAIYSTPIIDNHAHPLLKPEAQSKHPFLAITTEAHGDAMNATPSSLSHIRAVKQLSGILNCNETWDDVVRAIEIERAKPDDAWTKRCFKGIETVLIDDGLDGIDEVYDYSWHDRLTRSPCKRIVRIEAVGASILKNIWKQLIPIPTEAVYSQFMRSFKKHIQNAISDTEVVGFKSVICYRTGLAIPFSMKETHVETDFQEYVSSLRSRGIKDIDKIDGLLLNPWIVHETARLIQNSSSSHKKPFQFHTGLGDNDITLTSSSPSHLQEFIKSYPKVPIVLLHASYPWTKEAGYLASVYDNVYADIGEVFPFVSKEGQENVIREILELCPTEKILWSTDGHWFPETYLLAVIQVREALKVVLSEYMRNHTLSTDQAVKAVRDILFKTSNDLYDLKLAFRPIAMTAQNSLEMPMRPVTELETLTKFISRHSLIEYIRLQYLDYTATSRVRILPVRRATDLLTTDGVLAISITQASLGLLQNDMTIPSSGPSGEFKLQAILSSLRIGPSINYASVQCEFRGTRGSEVDLCPRSCLRNVLAKANYHGLEFLLGFEIEVVFMSHDGEKYTTLEFSHGHAWSSSRALHSEKALKLLEDIYETLAGTDIHLEQFHPESADGQYEFVLPPLPPLEAVDTLLHAREVIATVAARHGLRATLTPKPFPMQAGTASHVHVSIVRDQKHDEADFTQLYESFYAGILNHLRSIVAFTYSNAASYERSVDGCWAGGTWVAWGTQNRETALRKISGSHWEFKLLDGLANPYLALAAIIAAGISGVREKESLLLKDCLADPGLLTPERRRSLNISLKLPQSLEEAMQHLQKDQDLVFYLGDQVVTRYLDTKEAESKMLEGMDAEERRQWIIARY